MLHRPEQPRWRSQPRITVQGQSQCNRSARIAAERFITVRNAQMHCALPFDTGPEIRLH